MLICNGVLVRNRVLAGHHQQVKDTFYCYVTIYWYETLAYVTMCWYVTPPMLLQRRQEVKDTMVYNNLLACKIKLASNPELVCNLMLLRRRQEVKDSLDKKVTP